MINNLIQQNEYILQLSLKNDYALLNKNVMRHKMKRIQNKKHQTETYELNKKYYFVLMIKDLF